MSHNNNITSVYDVHILALYLLYYIQNQRKNLKHYASMNKLPPTFALFSPAGAYPKRAEKRLNPIGYFRKIQIKYFQLVCLYRKFLYLFFSDNKSSSHQSPNSPGKHNTFWGLIGKGEHLRHKVQFFC